MQSTPSPSPSVVMRYLPWIPTTLLLVILGWSWTLHSQVSAMAGRLEYVEKTSFTREQGLDLDRKIIYLQAKWTTQEEFNTRLAKFLDRIGETLNLMSRRSTPHGR